MDWKKTPPDVVAAFEKAAPKDARAVKKPMFGYPALFLNGNMFAGTFRDQVVVRLGEKDRAALLKEKGAVPFAPMPGRAMKEYVVVPAALVSRPAVLRAWLKRALTYADTLPAKKKK